MDLDEPSLEVTPDLREFDRDERQRSVYWNVQELRALADFVIDEIAPNDTGGAAGS